MLRSLIIATVIATNASIASAEQISVELRLLGMSQSVLEQIAQDVFPDQDPRPEALVLDAIQVSLLIRATQVSAATRAITFPRALFENGQSSELAVGRRLFFGTGPDDWKGPAVKVRVRGELVEGKDAIRLAVELNDLIVDEEGDVVANDELELPFEDASPSVAYPRVVCRMVVAPGETMLIRLPSLPSLLRVHFPPEHVSDAECYLLLKAMPIKADGNEEEPYPGLAE